MFMFRKEKKKQAEVVYILDAWFIESHTVVLKIYDFECILENL